MLSRIMNTIEPLITALRAVAEPTRLRLLALCSQGDLTVSELVAILSQSQPRVSRHLKLLTDAGLLERKREGSWVFYGLVHRGWGVRFVRGLLDQLPENINGDEQLARDNARLKDVKWKRDQSAQAYFRSNAESWDKLRSLHTDEKEVERTQLQMLLDGSAGQRIEDLLDIGTGTGRMLEVFGSHIDRGEGIDLSAEMLAIARSNLDHAGMDHCTVRHADIYAIPFAAGSFDAVTIHQVLHFLDQPARAIAEAVRVLRPGGRLLLVDFAPHDLEELRQEHNHRRLGFGDGEITAWFEANEMTVISSQHLTGEPLTVSLWLGGKQQRPPSTERLAP